MVTLPFRFGGIVRDIINDYRKTNNIPQPEEVTNLGVHRIRDTFFEYELELVTELTIDKDSIEYIDLFPNIKSLTFDGDKGLNGFEIKSVIDRYPNLEHLTIKGQSSVQTLNVSELKKLKSLEIVSNRALHRVVGLEQLDQLSEITFYDNTTYYKEEEICDAIAKMAQKGVKCNLDVLYMPTLQDMGNVPRNMNWCESAGLGPGGDKLQYTTEELEEAVKKAREIVGKYIKPGDSTKEQFAILYQWMCENVKYDHNALGSAHAHIVDGEQKGVKYGQNGTVNGLVYGSCVCEGYSKSMQMLLKLCDIPAFDVSCIAERSHQDTPIIDINGKARTHIGDHSILKVNIDGICYYSDVTWDASRYQKNNERKYFLLSSEDISTDHKLSGEKLMFTAMRSISPQEFEQLMQFASERIKSVDKKMAEDIGKKKTPEELLVDINKEIEELRQKYVEIAKQMESLMQRNAQSPISNYQQQLDVLIKRRDSINEAMSGLKSSQETYQSIIDYAVEEKHNAVIGQIERLFSTRIKGTADTGRFIKTDMGMFPQMDLKDKSTLRNEQGNINKRLDELYYDGQLDIKTWQTMKTEVGKEYEKLIAKAPTPPARKEEEKIVGGNQQQHTQQPLNRPYISQETIEQVEARHFREKYGYYTDMTEDERVEFDHRLESFFAEKKKTPKKTEEIDKTKLEEQRRELRRKQFQERKKAMGLGFESDLDLDNLLRQQELLDRQRIEMETEEIEHHNGIHM